MEDPLPEHGDRALAKQGNAWVKVPPEADLQPAREPNRRENAPRDPQPKSPGGPSATISVAAGCAFEGLLTFRGEAQVDGELLGEVVAQGTLRLGATARVRARIEVDELIVEGELQGDVVARRRIELSPSARVRGSIEAPRLSLAEGCVFQGRCRCLR
jgi:cytoskeletal protein CcmA (bactofilin family)